MFSLVDSGMLFMNLPLLLQIGFLRNTTVNLDEGTSNKKTLEQLLTVLPADMPPSLADTLSMSGGGGVVSPSTPGTGSSTQTPDTPGTPNSERKLFKSKGNNNVTHTRLV